LRANISETVPAESVKFRHFGALSNIVKVVINITFDVNDNVEK